MHAARVVSLISRVRSACHSAVHSRPLLQPALRLVYIGAYVGNVPPLRGLCWASALLCTGVLYLEGLKALLSAV